MSATTATRPAADEPDALREIKRRRQAREARPEEGLAAHTVESYLTRHREQIVAEMDALTGKLVEELHEACAKAKESLRAEFAAEAATAGPKAVLMVAQTGPHKGIAFKMTVGTTACFVGRSSGKKFREKGISLPKDNEVSTTHAKIELQRGAVVLVDVGSTNGTTVDGAAIEEGKPHPLKAGSTVVFGASTFAVHSIGASS
mmetsp:Transcript_14871/g.46136  ORF Transcript_14871/g.46136 Transcript_14871/m.46136 type:complete len:202 (-) Transcript_14871:61-666(-)